MGLIAASGFRLRWQTAIDDSMRRTQVRGARQAKYRQTSRINGLRTVSDEGPLTRHHSFPLPARHFARPNKISLSVKKLFTRKRRFPQGQTIALSLYLVRKIMQLQINGGGAPTRSGEPVDASVLTGLGGLPLATRQQLDAAVILVARSASTAIGTTEIPLPLPSTPVPWLLPIACVPVQPTVVDIPPPVVSALTMPAATGTPLAPPSRDPAWWQYSATPQPRAATLTRPTSTPSIIW